MQIEETQSNPNPSKKEGPRTNQGLAAYHRRCAAQIHPRRRRKTAAPLVREDRCSRLMASCACGQGHRRGATRRRRPHPSVGALAGEGARGGAAHSSGCHERPLLREKRGPAAAPSFLRSTMAASTCRRRAKGRWKERSVGIWGSKNKNFLPHKTGLLRLYITGLPLDMRLRNFYSASM